MAHLPSGGTSELATKGDIQRLELKVGGAEERLELKIDVTRQELRAEMQQMGRSLLLSFITVMAIMNGILFAALRASA